MAKIALRTLVGLLCGLAIGVASMVLLPGHSSDGRTAYDWSFVCFLIVILGIAVGVISGIAQAIHDQKAAR
jgi:hypothetical protein